MKKILFLLMALAAIVPARADNYFSLRTETVTAVNDTLWIHPNPANHCYKMYVTAHLDGYIDHWLLKMSCPNYMKVPFFAIDSVNEGPAMSVPYINMYGQNDTIHATLLTNSIDQLEGDQRIFQFGSTISTLGYWDPYNTGIYQSYGTVKWPVGNHDYLLSLWMEIPYGKVKSDLTFELTLTSTTDWRGVPLINAHPIRNFHIHVGYMPGDVNGNGQIDIADVIMAQDFVLNGCGGANPYEVDAADIDQNGMVSIADVSEIIDLMNNY